MTPATQFFAATLALALCAPAWAQTEQSTPKPATETASAAQCADHPYSAPCANLLPVQTIYLNNSVNQADENEIVNALRNTLPPETHIFLVFDQNAILIRATSDDIALAKKMVSELDRPKKSYRLTYTITDTEGGKPVGAQHFAMIVTPDQATSVKLGSKIPVATGSYSSGSAVAVQTQFTYVDVGMNFNVTVDDFADGVRLRSDVSDSSVGPHPDSIGGVTEPIIRNTELKSEAFLTPGKPLMLGSLDVPGSTGHMDIEVVMQPLP